MIKPSVNPDYLEVDDEGHKVYYGGLARMTELMKRIGNPEKKLKIIHIVGTAGKGTVAMGIVNILSRHGYKAGLFQSPQITVDTERISINGELISEEKFIEILNFFHPHIKYLRKHVKHGDLSPFELFTAMAYKYFCNQSVDYAVIEAGCGGKYDSTNVIEKSEISVLTSIGLDHQDILGDTNNIAKDKSSICEKSGHLITAVSDESILEIVRNVVSEKKAKLSLLDRRMIESVRNNFGDKFPEQIIKDIALSFQVVKELTGDQEIFEIDIKLPARYEKISSNPDVIIDGAHNISKINTLVDFMDLENIEKSIFVFSAFEDKDVPEMIEIIAKRSKKLFLTSMKWRERKSISLLNMKEIALKYLNKDQIIIEENSIRAFAEAKKMAYKSDTIIVTGSFHLAGDIRSLYWTKEKILYTRRII